MTIAVPGVTAGSGPTLLDYVEALGEQLGTYVEQRVSTAATVGEAARLVLCDELRDDEQERDQWAGAYVYARDGAQAGVQRRVLQTGYEGPLGGLLVSRPWAAALAQGTTVALTEPLPVREHLGVKSLVDLTNEALHLVDVEARITLTGDGTQTYPLTDYPFIRSRADVLGVLDRYGLVATDPYAPTPYPWDVVTDGATVSLTTGFAYPASDSFQVAVPVPADRLVYDGTAWAYTASPGLTNDTDQAAAKLDHVVAFGMVKGLRYLLRRAMSDRRLSDRERQVRVSDLAARLRPWARAAANVVRYELPKRQARAKQSIIGGTATTTAGFVGVP